MIFSSPVTVSLVLVMDQQWREFGEKIYEQAKSLKSSVFAERYSNVLRILENLNAFSMSGKGANERNAWHSLNNGISRYEMRAVIGVPSMGSVTGACTSIG